MDSSPVWCARQTPKYQVKPGKWTIAEPAPKAACPVIPGLIYPDPGAVADWLSKAFGFTATQAKIGLE